MTPRVQIEEEQRPCADGPQPQSVVDLVRDFTAAPSGRTPEEVWPEACDHLVPFNRAFADVLAGRPYARQDAEAEAQRLHSLREVAA